MCQVLCLALGYVQRVEEMETFIHGAENKSSLESFQETGVLGTFGRRKRGTQWSEDK